MPTCFVIQPFDRENNERYDEIFKPALLEAGVEPYRVDQDPGVDVPIAAIEDGIRNADICLADITTNNPNVWYELGFAFASQRPVVMICAKARTEKLPFDIRHRAVVPYETGSPRHFKRLHEEIVKRVAKRITEGSAPIEREMTPVPTELSREARGILKAAAEGDGHVLYATHVGTPGSTVQAGGRSMIPNDANHKVEVTWTGALRELEDLGYIRDLGAGSVFELTPAGYQVAESLPGVDLTTGHKVWIEINYGYDLGGQVELDGRALSIIQKHGGELRAGDWVFPDGSHVKQRGKTLVAS